MDVPEILGRVREKLRTRTESRDAKVIEDFILQSAPLPTPTLPEFARAPGALKAALRADAALLREGRWSLYGWREVQVGLPPRWHRDHAGGVEVPSLDRHLNHRSLPPGADARTIWEVNRWAEMVRLAMHARANGDAGAIQAAQAWLLDWVEKNPMGRGINWTSALEGGLRLMNFCWFDAIVCDGLDAPVRVHPGIAGTQRLLTDRIVPSHVWWVRRYASFGSSANNHRLGELTGLLLAVRRWSELEKFGGSAGELWSEIGKCVLAQFAEDGGNREQALHYHLFALEMALHAARAMDASDGPVLERLSVAALFFARMEQPGGEPWDYGDSDDARIVPLTAHRAHAASEWRAWFLGEPDGEALRFWLGNPPFTVSPDQPQDKPSASSPLQEAPQGAAASAAVSPATPSSPRPPHALTRPHWWSYPGSGMAVGSHRQWRVRLDASPLGFGRMAAHGHGDALHVSLWHDGQAVIIDPGTGGYFGAKELRAELAAWEAHNGPQPVDGYATPRRMGAFLLTQHHASPELSGRVSRDGSSIRATLRHEGHAFTRSVWFHERRGTPQVRIHDVESHGKPLRVRWHLAPECQVLPARVGEGTRGEPAVLAVRRGGKLWTLSFAGDDVVIRTLEARASRAYGRVEACPVIEVTARGQLATAIQEGSPPPDDAASPP